MTRTGGRSAAGNYLFAVAAVGLALLLRMPVWDVLGNSVPFVTFFPVVMLSAWRGGLGPGLLSTGLSAVAAVYLFLEPHGRLELLRTGDAAAIAVFLAVGAFISFVTARLQLAQQAERSARLLTEQTLIGIGDAVIATDTAGRVTFMNAVAERLTGWSSAEARTRPIEEVFNIVRELTGARVENPVTKALREGAVQGLANHTELIAKDGRRLAIDDSGAPIRDENGTIVGAVLVFRDITARRREEREAAVVKERLNFALEAGGGIGTWDWSVGSDIVYADARLARLFGLDPVYAAQGVPLVEYIGAIHPEDRTRIQEIISKCVANNADYLAEYRLLQGDGTVRWVIARGKCHADEGGRPAHFPGVVVDITDRKAAEIRQEFLMRLDDALRPLTDPWEVTQCAARLLGEHLGVNRCAYADVEEDEDTFNLTGDFNWGVPSIVGRYRFEQFGEECLRLMRAGEPYVVDDSEFDARTGNVKEAYRLTCIRSVICAPLLKSGRFVAAMAVHQTSPRHWQAEEIDLVQQVAGRCWESIERIRINRALAEREQKYRFLAESIPQMVWTATPEGALDYVNEQGATYFGAPAEALLGGGWLDHLHPEEREPVVARWKQALATGKPYETSVRLRRGADGAYRWHLVRALPFADASGSIRQWFGTCTDIEDQKATEAELTRTNRELEEFAYVASHDLQEPLRMVNAFTQQLLRKFVPDQPEAREYAGFIQQGVERMKQLIEDLLEFSRAVQGEVRWAVGAADLNASLAEARNVLDTRIRESSAEISAGPLPKTRGDTGQLAHVFQNLLSNAIKYRKADAVPAIRISAQRDGQQWIIAVADNGIGFEQKYAERIFGLFKRLHKNEYPGTGLGLAICQRIVERCGGRMWAEGRPGEGATFYFSIPAE